VFWIYSSVFNAPISEEAHKIDTPELAARQEETAKHAVRSRGVPTILKVQDGKVEVIDHTTFYGRPERITALAA
jgi:protein-disulfide isomerase-like protein with CxxC motif